MGRGTLDLARGLGGLGDPGLARLKLAKLIGEDPEAFAAELGIDHDTLQRARRGLIQQGMSMPAPDDRGAIETMYGYTDPVARGLQSGLAAVNRWAQPYIESRELPDYEGPPETMGEGGARFAETLGAEAREGLKGAGRLGLGIASLPMRAAELTGLAPSDQAPAPGESASVFGPLALGALGPIGAAGAAASLAMPALASAAGTASVEGLRAGARELGRQPESLFIPAYAKAAGAVKARLFPPRPPPAAPPPPEAAPPAAAPPEEGIPGMGPFGGHGVIGPERPMNLAEMYPPTPVPPEPEPIAGGYYRAPVPPGPPEWMARGLTEAPPEQPTPELPPDRPMVDELGYQAPSPGPAGPPAREDLGQYEMQPEAGEPGLGRANISRGPLRYSDPTEEGYPDLPMAPARRPFYRQAEEPTPGPSGEETIQAEAAPEQTARATAEPPRSPLGSGIVEPPQLVTRAYGLPAIRLSDGRVIQGGDHPEATHNAIDQGVTDFAGAKAGFVGPGGFKEGTGYSENYPETLANHIADEWQGRQAEGQEQIASLFGRGNVAPAEEPPPFVKARQGSEAGKLRASFTGIEPLIAAGSALKRWLSRGTEEKLGDGEGLYPVARSTDLSPTPETPAGKPFSGLLSKEESEIKTPLKVVPMSLTGAIGARVKPQMSRAVEATGALDATEEAFQKYRMNEDRGIMALFGGRGKMSLEDARDKMLSLTRYFNKRENQVGWPVVRKLVEGEPLNMDEFRWRQEPGNRAITDELADSWKKYRDEVGEEGVPEGHLRDYYSHSFAPIFDWSKGVYRPGNAWAEGKRVAAGALATPALDKSRLTSLKPTVHPIEQMMRYVDQVGKKTQLRPIVDRLMKLRDDYEDANEYAGADFFDDYTRRTVLGEKPEIDRRIERGLVAPILRDAGKIAPGAAFDVGGEHGYTGHMVVGDEVRSAARGKTFKVTLDGRPIGQTFTPEELAIMKASTSFIGRARMGQTFLPTNASQVEALASRLASYQYVAGLKLGPFSHHARTDAAMFSASYGPGDQAAGLDVAKRYSRYLLGNKSALDPDVLAKMRRVGLVGQAFSESEGLMRIVNPLERTAFGGVIAPDTITGIASYFAAERQLTREHPEMTQPQIEARAAIIASRTSNFTAQAARSPLNHPLWHMVTLFQNPQIRQAMRLVYEAQGEHGVRNVTKLLAAQAVANTAVGKAFQLSKPQMVEMIEHSMPFGQVWMPYLVKAAAVAAVAAGAGPSVKQWLDQDERQWPVHVVPAIGAGYDVVTAGLRAIDEYMTLGEKHQELSGLARITEPTKRKLFPKGAYAGPQDIYHGWQEMTGREQPKGFLQHNVGEGQIQWAPPGQPGPRWGDWTDKPADLMKEMRDIRRERTAERKRKKEEEANQ